MPQVKKAAKKAAKKPKGTPPSPNPARPHGLNVRQARFAELVASGDYSATQAYLAAGYKVSENVARTNGPRLLANAAVDAYLADLRKPHREFCLMSKDFKRGLMRDLATNPSISPNDRIRAAAEDARLAGHYEPDRSEIDLGNKTLLSITERALGIASGLVSSYGTPEDSDDSQGQQSDA